MMDDDTYRTLFVAESRENHENLVKNLLILEERSDDAAIDEIFRSAHTLKGMSASMGFGEMERLCHSMEDVFQLLRTGQLAPFPRLIDLLLACTDRIEEMLDDIEGGGDSSAFSSGALVRDLHAVAEGAGDDGEQPEESLQEYVVTVTLDAACTMQDVRAMLILQNLEELGAILSVTPAMEAIEEGDFPGTFTVTIATDAGREAVGGAVSHPEVVEVAFGDAEGTQSAPEADPTPANTQSRAEKSREVKNLRVDIHRLDQMMNLVEDLVINGGRLKQVAKKYQIKEMDEALAMVSRSVSDLQNLTMHIRMIPLNQIFNRFPRVVRDVAHHDGKEVDFIMEGGETELDRSVMDGLSDPLLHLIRNAVNHGIETPKERIEAGKPAKGNVLLSAWREQGNVIIELSDDGAGIDREKVLGKAIEKGLVSPENAELLKDDEIVNFLFAPGFSTAEEITDISGRGVGLDVVKSTIESLNGSISVKTDEGKGTRFRLILPPTMAIVEVMMVRINGKRCAIPINTVVEVASADPKNVHRIGDSEAILLRDEVLQIYTLEDMFGRSGVLDIVVVVQYQGRKCCIPVDGVEGQQEVVVKPVSHVIGTCRGVGGVTIPGDGDVVPILDVNTMI
jgi:two-component system chemotaxis sensor kinase CheA